MPLTATKLDYRVNFSELEEVRRVSTNLLPTVLQIPNKCRLEENEALGAVADHDDIKNKFPKTYGLHRVTIRNDGTTESPKPQRIGVVLSGGQAPGGHNVIAGIYDYVKKISAESSVIGFLNGPHGVFTGNYTEIDDDFMNAYRNSGGFDMIGSGRHKIEKPEDFASSLKNATELGLTGMVVIGGDDSNTNAAILGEYFASQGSDIKVCGAPKTIDGDLKVHPYIPTSFGFDTACKTYSELIGNLCKDTLSSQKYYHFVRLMGRSASHIALECALLTRPNVCVIGEEVEAEAKTMQQVTNEIVDVIIKRSDLGKNYGIVLIPEGLIEFIPEFNALISEINELTDLNEAAVMSKLSPENKKVFEFLPSTIRAQLLLDRDPHGNVQVSKIETEKLISMCVESRLEELRSSGGYDGSYNPQFHSFGYEGRSGLPSHFDATYCYVLGQNVAALMSMGQTGLISSVTDLDKPVSEWSCGGVPITMMCNMERRHGKMKPVIKKALTELDNTPFLTFKEQRADWGVYDLYRSPGPLQFFGGDTAQSCELSITLKLELDGKDSRMDYNDVKAAIAVQQAAVTNNKKRGFIHCPLLDQAQKIQSAIEITRKSYTPKLCPVLSKGLSSLTTTTKGVTQAKYVTDRDLLKSKLPLTYASPLIGFTETTTTTTTTSATGNIGVVFVGRQAPGGHDVIAGIYDMLPEGSKLYGFVNGSVGLLDGHSVELTKPLVDAYRGQGGFDLLGRSVDRLSNTSNYDKLLQECKKLKLSGLVLIGGCRTATDASQLSEYIASKGDNLKVVTVPVDITGQIISELCEISVGFDTATKESSHIVGNNATDGASAKKYYYFMRIMGGASSHTSLEVSLQCKPNYVLLSEEASLADMSLEEITNSIADVICARAKVGKNYGTVIFPESLIESISEMKMLVKELDALFTEEAGVIDASRLTSWSKAVFDSLPEFTRDQLTLQRSSSDTLQLSQVETERLFFVLVETELKRRAERGEYDGTFAGLSYFLGYQARGSAPSNFDVQMGYNLGASAVGLIAAGFNGYMAVINNVKKSVDQWSPAGVPIAALLQSSSTGLEVPVARVDLTSPSYMQLKATRDSWSVIDRYENPGPIQFYGPSSDVIAKTLINDGLGYHAELEEIQIALNLLQQATKPGSDGVTVRIAHRTLTALADSVKLLEGKRQRR